MKKTIKMLKPGTFKDMKGKVVTLTAAHLQATAAAYNPAIYACPMVVGHPTVESPSYGKIGIASFADGFLNGEPSQVAPEFVKVVNGGYYDHVSLSLFEPDAPSNPVPGVYYPRHLGFLGAAAPAVPGLGTVSFAADEGTVCFALDLGDWNDRTIARMFRNIKNYLIEAIGAEKADKVIDEYDLQSVTEDAVKPEMPAGTCCACGMPCADCCCAPNPATSTLNYSAPSQGGTIMLTATQIAAKELELNQREAAVKLQENTKLHAENLSFADGLVAGGKLLAANKAAVVGLLDFASGVVSGDTIEFGEGAAKKTESPADIIKNVLGSYPKVIELGELAGGEEAGAAKTDYVDVTKFM